MPRRAAYRRGITAAAVWLACCGGAYAQAIPNNLTPERGATTFTLSIINQTDRPVSFLLRPKEGQWAEYSVKPNEKPIYSCAGCDGVFEIRLRTGETTVDYNLNSGTLYAIETDASRGIYDIYKVE